MPLVIVEAMTRGIAVVSSDCPTGPSEVINKENGWLYPVNNEGQLQSIIQSIIDDKHLLPSPIIIQKSVSHFEVSQYGISFLESIRNYL